MNITSSKLGGKRVTRKLHRAMPSSAYEPADAVRLVSWQTQGEYFNLRFGMDGRSYNLRLTADEAHQLYEAFKRTGCFDETTA
jgi:hypothetical protein